MVKIELGAHIDGYITSAAHTVVVGASKENKVTDKKAKAIASAYNAMEMVLRMLRPEKAFKNTDVSEHIDHMAKLYGTTPIENMLSHQTKRNKMKCQKEIVQNPTDEYKTKLEKCTFENYEVYVINILVSTGDGKSKPRDSRTTVYKKADDFEYQLKLKASRAFFSETVQKFGSMAFSLRHFDDEKKAKMGVVECERHGLMQPYRVLYEKEGEYVAQFKTTAIVMPTGIFKICGLPLDLDSLNCDMQVEDEKLAALLREPLRPKKKKPAKKTTTNETKECEEAAEKH